MTATVKPAIEVQPPRPRGRPKAEDLAELKARLISVARRAFIANGYGQTSMSEVAKAARVSKTTLYSRFPSKADLFRAIIDDQVHRTLFALREVGRPKSNTLEAKLRFYAENALRDNLSADNLQLNRLIYGESGRFPELGEAALARSRRGVARVAGLIRDYAAQEGVSCRDPEGAAEIYMMMVRSWYLDAMLANRPFSAEEISAVVDRVVRIFLASREAW